MKRKLNSVSLLMIFTAASVLISGCGSDSSSEECGLSADKQSGIRICSFVASPTASESITLKNYTAADVNLNNYSLWDQNAANNGSGQKTLQNTDVIPAGGKLTFGTLPFGINDSGENIYLKDSSGTVIDSRSN